MNKETKKCPFCGEEILATAKKCKHCKQFLNDDTNMTSKKFAVNKNVVIGVVVGAIAIVAISISTFVNNSQNSLYSGCELEASNNTLEKWYCPNNQYYDMLMVGWLSYRAGSEYPNYYVYRGKNIYQGHLIAQMIREDGEYVCSTPVNPDKIYDCNERKLTKMAIENSGLVDNFIAINKHKTKISNAQSTIGMSRAYFAERNTDWPDKTKNNWRFPKDCKELISIMKNDLTDFDINTCQMKFEDGTVAVLSADISKGTIYSIEDGNGVYVSFDILNNLDIASKTRFNYTDDIMPADKYINDNPSLRRFTKEEMEAEKLYE